MESKGIPASAIPTRRAGGGTPPTGGTPPSFPAGGAPGGGGLGGVPTSLPAGVTQAQYAAALAACRSLLPTGGFGGRGTFTSPAFAAYRNCLAAHGVTVNGPGTTAPSTPSTTIAAGVRQAAIAACAPLRPAAGTGATSTTVAG